MKPLAIRPYATRNRSEIARGWPRATDTPAGDTFRNCLYFVLYELNQSRRPLAFKGLPTEFLLDVIRH